LLGAKHKQVELRCAVSGFEVTNGVAKADSFVIDAEATEIDVSGSVDMNHESLDLEANPKPKNAGVATLRTPLQLKGPLRHPKIRPKPGPLVARAAAALGLGAINPGLAALALTDKG